MSVGHCKYKRIRLHDIKNNPHEKYILIYLVRVVVLLLPLIVNGSVSTSFETTRNTLYKTQLPKVLHSVFRDLFFLLFSSIIIQWISGKSKCFFSTNEKNFRQRETTRKTGLFSKKILPLIVNGSGCVLLPFRCGLPLIVNGSGMRASSLPVRTSVNR